MSSENVCPKCGSKLSVPEGLDKHFRPIPGLYACKSGILRGDFRQSTKCKDNQLAQAQARIAEMETSLSQECVNESCPVSIAHDRVRRGLDEATKAGTPFAKERDTMNAYVIENQRLTKDNAVMARALEIAVDIETRSITNYFVWQYTLNGGCVSGEWASMDGHAVLCYAIAESELESEAGNE